MPNNTLVSENEEFLEQFKHDTLMGTSARLVLRLTETTARLKAVTDQAEAQFKAGDSHATFNKQTIEAINKPLIQSR